MTEGQLRYQSLREDLRHNQEMEHIQRMQAQASQKQAEASSLQANVQHRRVSMEEELFPITKKVAKYGEIRELWSTARSVLGAYNDAAEGMKRTLGLVGQFSSLFA